MHTKAIMFYLDDRKDLCIRKKYEMKIQVRKKKKAKKDS
jgi:hypothetical protein